MKSEIPHCIDCGLPIQSGKRCAMHAQQFSIFVQGRGDTPSDAEKRAIIEISKGRSVRQIAEHLNVHPRQIAELLECAISRLRRNPVHPGLIGACSIIGLRKCSEDWELRLQGDEDRTKNTLGAALADLKRAIENPTPIQPWQI